MATIAEQLTSLANTKTAIKDAIVAKGVAVADTDPFSAYPDKIGQIQAGGGGAPATKFGASIDTWIGDVDENGTLKRTTWTGVLNFAGVKIIDASGLYYAFSNCIGITSVDLSSLQRVYNFGLYAAFDNCSNITSVDLSSLQSVGSNGLYCTFRDCIGITGAIDLSSLQSVDSRGLSYTFEDCAGITSVDLSSLQSVGSYGLANAFYNCSNITSVDLSSLQSVDSNGLYYAFYNCTKLTAISFPSLTSVQTNSFALTTSSGMFRNCTGLTEIHFRADMQATIEALTGYSNKWGATNASIFFDL